MFQLWTISLFVILVVHDSVFSALPGEPSEAGHVPFLYNLLGAPGVAAATLVPLMLVALAVHLLVGADIRRLQRGELDAAYSAERVVGFSRWVVVALHAASILLFGWLDVIRSLLGDVVVVDEAVAILPSLGVFVLGWVSVYPIERSLRESTQMRVLDEGLPFYPIPSRRQFVALNLRHNLLLSIVPLLLILMWAELVERVLGWAVRLATAQHAQGLSARLLLTQDGRQFVTAVLQIVGVLGVFIVGPLVMRLLWDTVRLPHGPLRDRLLEICRAQGIRVRELLVWRTYGSMINGAVIGLLAPARYILLTDALIDSMPGPQVEAVMAHELAHVKQHHMGWLAVVMLVGVGYSAAAGGLVAAMLGLPLDDSLGGVGVQLGLSVGAFALAMFMFGWVSRRFEWQADALAAAFLSDRLAAEGVGRAEPAAAPGAGGEVVVPAVGAVGMVGVGGMSLAGEPPMMVPAVVPPASGRAAVVTAAGAGAMAGALDTVARLNHIPHHRPSWRHGSIAARQRRLAETVGKPARNLPISRVVRVLKRVSAILLVLLFVAGIVSAIYAEVAPG